MKKISFIIVNFNTAQLLKECIETLVDIWPNMEIIVVDNGSSDNSVVLVEDYERKGVIKLIRNENTGLASAHNKALNLVSGDYICYLGTDAFPDKEAIKKLFGFMELAEKAGIVTPKLVLKDGSIDWDAHRGFPTPWVAMTHFLKLDRLFPKSKAFNGYFLGWKDMSTPHEIDACIAHFMFTRKELYTDGFNWDAAYFVFGEDIDFCYRVKKKDYKIFYLPDIEVLHYKGASVGRKSAENIDKIEKVSKETRLRMARATTQAMKIFYRKHYLSVYPKVLTSFVLFVIGCIEFVRVCKVKLAK
jgi:GT2 family glycosyltransferase